MDSNQVIGKAEGATVDFAGEGNILVVEDSAQVAGCTFRFAGDNSLMYISRSNNALRLAVDAFSDSVFALGADCSMNGAMQVSCSEHKHVFIGSDCMFSFGIWLRTSDVHLIYSATDGKRVNEARSIYIGDNVWLGQGVNVLKGTEISSGAIVGAQSVAAGKHIPHNTSWAGNPARLISEGVFWDRTSTHAFTHEMSEASANYEDFLAASGIRVPSIFEMEPQQIITTAELDAKLSEGTAEEKLEYVQRLYTERGRNSFVWA